jgi:hypothetical protein
MSDEQTPRPAGVELAPPPAIVYSQIAESVEAFAQTLRPNEQGGLIGIATTKGVNVAIVQRIGGHSTIVGWVGKRSGWGAPLEGGLAWKLRW